MYNYETRRFKCDNCDNSVKDIDEFSGWIQIQRDGLDDFVINFTSIENGELRIKEIRDLSELDFCCPQCLWDWCSKQL